MAGIVLVYRNQIEGTQGEPLFRLLVKETCEFKNFKAPENIQKGENFIAAKLDKDHSVFPGLIRDQLSDSWLMVMGWIVDSKVPCKKNNLSHLIKNLNRI